MTMPNCPQTVILIGFVGISVPIKIMKKSLPERMQYQISIYRNKSDKLLTHLKLRKYAFWQINSPSDIASNVKGFPTVRPSCPVAYLVSGSGGGIALR